jgi:effector-binding domain-containing protein
MFKKILYSIVITIFTLLVAGMFLPSEVHVERSIPIQRSAATVFTVLNSYRHFPSWSPWADRDPAMETGISGPERGVGARMSWRGDARLVGSGWQEIIESKPHELVRIRLEFDQQGAANAYYAIEPTANGVQVTWGFDTNLLEGQSWFRGLLARYFGLFFDRWIGADYELGLARLKVLVENMPAVDFADLDAELIEAGSHDILYVSTTHTGDPVDTSPDLAAAYREITAFMALHGIERAAQPMAITRDGGIGRYELEAAIPVVLKDVEPSGRVRSGQSPAGRALRVTHHGPYQDLELSYQKLAAWAAAHGIATGPVSWEHYISDPGETLPENLITHIYVLLANGS